METFSKVGGLALSVPTEDFRSPGTSPPSAGGKSECAPAVPPRRRPPEDQKALGRTIQMLRERHEHLTQAILAKRVKIDVRTLRKLEKGKSETSWATVVSLASALSVTLEYFAELHDAFVREELAGACFSPPLAGGSPQVEKRFLVEATSTRNEGLITELPARDARDAKDRAIHEFMCEGHGILPSTVSAIAAQGEGS